MNLIQQAEHLKMLPDQTIAQMQQNPGQTPPYLILAEMQRRETMRKAYQASNAQNPMGQPSVNQQIAQRFQQSAPMPPQGQQGYAGVGIVGYAGGSADPTYYPGAIGIPMPEGGLNGMALNPTDIDQMYGASPGIGDSLKTLQGVRKPSNRSAIAEALAAREDEYRNKKTRLGDVLMNLGLSMAASRRPDFLGALAEGGIGALTGYTRDKERNLSQADKYATQRMAVLENEQRSEDSLLEQAAGLNRSQIAERNNAIATLEASKRAMANAQSTAEWHKANNEAQKAIAVINANQRASAAAAKLAADTDKANKDRQSRETIAKTNADARVAGRAGKAKGPKEETPQQLEKRLNLEFKKASLEEMKAYPDSSAAAADPEFGVKVHRRILMTLTPKDRDKYLSVIGIPADVQERMKNAGNQNQKPQGGGILDAIGNWWSGGRKPAPTTPGINPGATPPQEMYFGGANSTPQKPTTAPMKTLPFNAQKFLIENQFRGR